MLEMGNRRYEIAMVLGDCVVLRGTERHVSQPRQDLYVVHRRELTAAEQQMVEAWEEVAYRD